jgi:hypothetical protein
LLSEYGINTVNNPIHVNRILRENNLINVRVEKGLELLDAGASQAFATADHQIAHVYVNDKTQLEKVRTILNNIAGYSFSIGRKYQKRLSS